MPNEIGGPIEQENVVGEIRGYEKPDEVVILGAHLDSWELGTGALDNGCNASLVIEAARAIKAMGLVPKRTIRFILFSGEEQGTIGSFAYVNLMQPNSIKSRRDYFRFRQRTRSRLFARRPTGYGGRSAPNP
jgi:Zn-dependent M28 family amino/carboxypeptidase